VRHFESDKTFFLGLGYFFGNGVKPQASWSWLEEILTFQSHVRNIIFPRTSINLMPLDTRSFD
jgi:hypothetical protein